MIYVVTGFLRSYTTMMMHCLEAGGMTPVWDSDRDDWAATQGTVNPNNEMREINQNTLDDFRANPARYSGRLIKILSKYGYLNLPPWQYKVLLMMRNPEEIRQSFHRVFDKPLVYTGDNGEQVPLTDEMYYGLIFNTANELVAAGITPVVVKGDKVIANPLGAFNALRDRGWPIDPEKAAAVVQPAERHCVA